MLEFDIGISLSAQGHNNSCRNNQYHLASLVETPDRTGREAILKVYASRKELPLVEDVNLGDIASMTTGFTG